LSYPNIAQQTIGEPLANPWYTPGWSAQDPDYAIIPANIYQVAGFPSDAVYVTVTANFFDDDGNPISGYLTFYPSTSVTLTSDNVTTVIPQRFVGQNLWDIPGVYWGTGKMYLHNGNLLVNLLATDNASVSMSPVNFTYSVVEHWLGGRCYDISVPSNSSSPVDINSLIIPGSVNGEVPDCATISIAAVSTEYLAVNISAQSGGINVNPTTDDVNFAFIAGPSEPSEEDWNAGSWASSNPPYLARILIGPANDGLVLEAGSYVIWVQIVSDSEVPVFPVGTLVIY
jgi:hypothetical protein